MEIVYWLANGFAPGNPHGIDAFSLASLLEAADRYSLLRKSGEDALFLLPNSIVRDKSGTVLLRDTMLAVAREFVPEAQLAKLETTGATTDCLALAQSASAFRAEKVMACCTTPETARYFRAMYYGVTKYVRPGRKLEVRFVMPVVGYVPRSDMKSRVPHTVLWLVTVVASVTRPAFMNWYNFLNWVYQRRLRGFSRTVNQ